jgi:hypothetical protein
MKTNDKGKALGFVARDGDVLTRSATRLRNVVDALGTLDNITGDVANFKKDAEDLLAKCEDCRRSFFVVDDSESY